MITDILELTPEFGFQESIEYKTMIDEAETGEEVRDALVDDGLREFKLTLEYRNQTYIDTIWDFYIARQGATDDFLIKIITDFATTDEPIGVGDGTTRQFLLHNFPVDTSTNNSMKINGIANINYVLSNDTANEKSYVTFSTAPALGDILTGSYEYYFRVRFKEDKLTRELMNYKLLNMGIELKEVRWNTYFPYSGNSSSSSSSSSTGGISTRWYALSGNTTTGAVGSIAMLTNYDGYSQVYQEWLPRSKNCAQVIPLDMAITGFRFYFDTAPGLGKKRVFTLYLNDQPTRLSLTISGMNKSGTASYHVQCRAGDYIYLREDIYNSPADTSISWGAACITGHPQRCPLLGCSNSGGVYHPILNNSWVTTGSIFYNYANDDSIQSHSLFTTPGYLRNLYLRHAHVVGRSDEDTCEVLKYEGSNKLTETELITTLTKLNITASNVDNFVRVVNGDLLTVRHTFGNMVQMISMEFVPDTPKESCHAGSHFSNMAQDSQGKYKFCSLHGWMRPSSEESASGEQNKEIYTLCPISGKIKNFTIYADDHGIVPGFPWKLTLRKNGIDTNLSVTLTSNQPRGTINGCLNVNVGDRLSFKIDPSENSASGIGGDRFALGWTFVSDVGGEWPIFGNLTYRY